MLLMLVFDIRRAIAADVGELIGINNTWLRNQREIKVDESLDDIKNNGIYFGDNDTIRGVMIVATYGYGTIQIVAGAVGLMKMRVFWGSWFNWSILS